MQRLKKLIFSSLYTHNIGLCLGGGGALGFAHIGVIQALEDHDIYVECIAGTSMGAIIGAFYANGYSPSEMLQMIKNERLYKVTKLMSHRPTLLKSGLSTHATLKTLIKDLIPANTFESLKRKLYICVTNLNNSSWEIVSSGENLNLWVAASASIPGIFEAIELNNSFYLDGGILNNLPAQALAPHCKHIIGSNVTPYFPTDSLSTPFDTLMKTARIVLNENSKKGADLCDFLINIPAIQKYHEFSYDQYQEIYQAGYSTTTKFIQENAEILKLQK